MAWTPGNYSGGGVWRTLSAYTAQKNRKASVGQIVSTSGSLVSVLADVVCSATSTLATILNPRTATLALTLDNTTVSSAAQLKIKGSLSATLADTVLTATVGPLQTPVVTNFSATGTAPVVLSLTDGDYVAGKYLEWEFAGSLTPAKNADGSYTTPTQRGIAFIDGQSWSTLDLALGYNDPSGPFAFHCRVLRDNENGAVTASYVDAASNTITFNADVGGWSTDYTDTIAGSVAKLNSITGVNKARYITVNSPYFASFHNANVGNISAVRATVPVANTKWHAEFRIDGWNNLGGKVAFGVTDGTRNLDANNGAFTPGTEPGLSGTAGATFTLTSGQTSFGVTIPAAAVGDYIILEGDTSTNMIKVYYWSLSTGALVNSGNPVATRTLTGTAIPAQWYVWQGGVKGQSNGSLSDALTFFPTTTKMAYSSGYSYYG